MLPWGLVAYVAIGIMFVLPLIIGIIYRTLRDAPPQRPRLQMRAQVAVGRPTKREPPPAPSPPFVVGPRAALTHGRTVIVVRDDAASFDEDLRLWVRGVFPHQRLHWGPPAAPTDAAWGDVVVVPQAAHGAAPLAWPHVHVVWVVEDPAAPTVRAWTERDGDARARAVVEHAVAPLVPFEDPRPSVLREPALVVRYLAAERRFA